jgi:hypothetical protein
MTREDWLHQEIENYQKRVETYQLMIAEWQRELGIQAAAAVAPLLGNRQEGKKKASGSDLLSLVQGMVFFNKSQPEACQAFLEMVGYPVRTAQIMEAVEKGGVKVGGKDAGAKKQNLYTILHRSSQFALVAKDTWGLVGWPGVPKKTDAEPEQRENNEKE